MLPGARQIRELEVDKFDVVILDQLADVRSGFVFGYGVWNGVVELWSVVEKETSE
jgi:hypothetical protein